MELLLRLLAHAKQGAGYAPYSHKPAANSTTISTSAGYASSEDDDGPFFDLELSLLLEDDEARLPRDSDSEDDDSEEFDLPISPDGARYGRVGGGLRRDPVAYLSPSDDIFFNGRLLPLEPSSLGDLATSEPPPSSKPQVPSFLLKSAAKLRILKLGFHKKPKSGLLLSSPTSSPAKKQQLQSKLLDKTKAEDAPLSAIFTRESSSRSSCSARSVRLYGDEASPLSEVRKLPRDVIQRYISKIKPLYISISKRYGEKLRFSGPLGGGAAGKVRPAGESGEPPVHPLKELAPVADHLKSSSLKSQDGNLPTGLGVVCRRLRKSRSASAAVCSMRSLSLAAARRDDSLLEQQDGIQRAIAHCKRSLNGGSESPLMRCRSDPGDGRWVEFSSSRSRNSSSSSCSSSSCSSNDN